jgi:hypothetical protein
MNINLHIDRLVLDGLPFAGPDAGLLQNALETELTRLLVADGQSGRLDFSSGATSRLTAPGIRVMNGNPTLTGEEIARSVHGGLTK